MLEPLPSSTALPVPNQTAFKTQNVSNQFTIATGNLLNFALPNRLFYDNTDAYRPEQYRDKVARLATIIRGMQPDIMGCQEVWDEDALIALAQQAGLQGYHVTAPLASNQAESPYTQGNGAQGTPAMGLMSRFPIIKSELLLQVPKLAQVDVPDVAIYQQFNRPPLIAEIAVNEKFSLTFVVAHLKSKRPHFLQDSNGQALEDSRDPYVRVRAKLRSLCMRASEAAGIRQAVIERLLHTHQPLVLVGDMNDVMQSVTSQLLSETSEIHYDKSVRDIALFEATQIQTRLQWLRDVAYTHVYQGMPEVLDQILLSEEFYADSKFATAQVLQVDYFNDHLKFDLAQRPTDHGLVRAKILIK